MIGLGTVINIIAIFLGGLSGIILKKVLLKRHQVTMLKACGIAVMTFGIGGAMEKMLTIQNGSIYCGKTMMIIICLSLGAFLGEMFKIEENFEKFGMYIKKKSGNVKEKGFVDAFVNTSLAVAIGAMAIVGAIEDGALADITILKAKSVLDFVLVMVFTASLGKGAIFSFIPVAILQGTITIFASFLKPMLTDLMLTNISLIGSILIFAIGINLTIEKKIKVANLLPAILVAIIVSLKPFCM